MITPPSTGTALDSLQSAFNLDYLVNFVYWLVSPTISEHQSSHGVHPGCHDRVGSTKQKRQSEKD